MILFATGNVLPSRLGALTARVLRDTYHEEIKVVASHSSWRIWTDADFSLIASVDNITDMPRAVITGLSSPNSANDAYVEKTAVRFANDHRVPIVFIVDEAGCERRTTSVPQLYLVNNEFTRKSVRDYAGMTPAVTVVGDNAASIIVPDHVQKVMESAGEKFTVVVSAGKDARTRGIVDYCLRCLEESIDHAVLIPSVHPGTKTATKESWLAAIANFSKRHPGSVLGIDGANGDQLAAAADMTVTLGGSLARVAGYNKKIPVLVTSGVIRELLTEDVGQEHHPLVEWGLAQELDLEYDPIPFRELGVRDKNSRDERRTLFAGGFPFSPELAAEAIVNLIR